MNEWFWVLYYETVARQGHRAGCGVLSPYSRNLLHENKTLIRCWTSRCPASGSRVVDPHL
jgi:hypothetical protein